MKINLYPDDSIEYNFNDAVTGNLSLIAKWEKVDEQNIVHLVKFENNGTIISIQIIKDGKKVLEPPTPTYNDYIFLGWYNGENKYNFNDEVTSDLILQAKYEYSQNSQLVYYIVSFNTNGGNNISSQIVESGKMATVPTQPTRVGYKFLGWYLDDNLYSFISKITKSITLTAKWQNNNDNKKVYYIIFNSNGGDYVSSQVVESGKKITIPINPTKVGYTFDGWYMGSEKFDFNTIINKNITLYAHWIPKIEYTITFNSNGGNTVAAQTVESGNRVIQPPNPTRKWYSFVAWKYNGNTFDFNTEITSNIELIAEWKVSSLITLSNGIDLISNSKNINDMKNNTITLQKVIDMVSDSGGGTIKIPAGIYYFSLGGRANNSRNERYAIKPKNNVHLIGAGTNENSINEVTILKPYFKCDGSGNGSMDMFYFNNYADTGFNTLGKVTVDTKRNVNYTDMDGHSQTLINQSVYLINADFSDFIIDGTEVNGCSYETDGKGFMINLFKDCDWNNVIVKNTDATGFGIDCPINSTITNCMAINCGKNAKNTDEGASGFGIGVGYANNEKITITNSLAINNKKFGFFFEHQARFNSTAYTATKSNGFVVRNSIAGGNMYDFGGLKAFNVTYDNVLSVSGKGMYYSTDNLNISKKNINISNNNVYPVYFSMYSKNINLINNNFSNNINDVSSSNKYASEIKWAINNGLINLDKSIMFFPNNTVSRFEAINALYKYKYMPGQITIKKTSNERIYSSASIKTIGFSDLDGSQYINDLYSVIWGYNSGIISKDTKFRPSDNVTRAEFITMLYCMAGLPNVNITLPFTDVANDSWYYNAVKWGYQKGILQDIVNTTTFAPSTAITKTQMAVFLYRFNNL